ncbi:hypothetical protein RHSIM_Rhsim13G0161700 [Rhododendron simsii]|uniref:Gnk2-homologous domain-containing protein n=1 Tax=Rhododendron simsii TaxID=118357 RepID=A0A834L6S6_RHOSS|nr:hypothetical protein RHSIM_Rhsim13G0161700 [Rhododendron simsii]
MANLPHKMPGKALFVYSMCLLSLIPIIKAAPTFRSIDCNSTVPTDQALCSGVTTDVCRDCLDYAKRDAVVRCPGSKPFSIVYDECTVRNSTVSAPTIEGVDPTFSWINCPNITLTTTGTYAPNSTYEKNLASLLSVLSSNSNASNGFYNHTVGTSTPDGVYGLFLCRGDLTVSACRDCVTYASTDVVQQCPRAKQVMIWYDECILRYSNDSIFAVQETREWVILVNPQNVTDETRYSEVLGEVMNNIAARALSGDSRKKFATGEANFTSTQLVYGLAQCMPDLSNFDCDSCLRNSISKFLYRYRGCRVYFPNCFVRGELYPFYNLGVGGAPPPSPSPVLPPPPPSTNSTRWPGKTFFCKAWIWDIILKF